MLAKMIDDPEGYLDYSRKILNKSDSLTNLNEVWAYYEELCRQFKVIYFSPQIHFLREWGELLEIDAQIQILLELTSSVGVFKLE